MQIELLHFRVPLRDSSDPRWIGAWWIGFLGCSVAAVLNAFPILMFARELPEAKKHRLKDVNQVHAVSHVEENDEMLKGNVKSLPAAIWVFCTSRDNFKSDFLEYSKKPNFCHLHSSGHFRVYRNQRICGFHAQDFRNDFEYYSNESFLFIL